MSHFEYGGACCMETIFDSMSEVIQQKGAPTRGRRGMMSSKTSSPSIMIVNKNAKGEHQSPRTLRLSST